MSAAIRLKIRHPMKTRERNVFGSSHPKFLLALARAQAGLTSEELALIVKAKGADARGRCRELVLMGYVENSGKTRRTSSGRHAIVWRCTAAGVKKSKGVRGQ